MSLDGRRGTQIDSLRRGEARDLVEDRGNLGAMLAVGAPILETLSEDEPAVQTAGHARHVRVP